MTMKSSRRAPHDRPSSAKVGTTTCSKGHLHSAWNTTGVLRIAKCESVCGFCQKETKTAANLRKHVAIHIRNEGLDLSIAEGSSGRGRLEMPQTPSSQAPPCSTDRERSSYLSRQTSTSTTTSTSASTSHSDSDSMDTDLSLPYNRSYLPPASDAFSPSAVLMSMATHSHPTYTLSASTSPTPYQNPAAGYSHPPTYTPPPPPPPPSSHPHSHPHSNPPSPFPLSSAGLTSSLPPPPPPQALPLPHTSALHQSPSASHAHADPFKSLRAQNLAMRYAWTAIPSSEGFRILDVCKSLSSAHTHLGPADVRVPCYNRETIYDEEWQAHMKDVHGVFLLWPETWMKRVEVLDLTAWGDDIGALNGVLMEN
ncbi:hypothetical protein BUE80_DR007145 [Diplocarpon rosae]|nr:hypothetical protein BUE80_DR007145 [Diplocarpon rosae]